jgi:hypothetical protein
LACSLLSVIWNQLAPGFLMMVAITHATLLSVVSCRCCAYVLW